MIKPVLAAAAAVSLLSACAAYDLEATRAMAPQGDAFTAALHDAYLERAQFEKDEGDWADARAFNMQAMMAAAGTAPPVPELAARGLSGADLAAGRAALVERLGTAAPMNTPEACAQAQAWFEHWMEQVEEGHQPDHIAEAQQRFTDWLEQCQPAAQAMAAEFVVYFPHDSAALTTSAAEEVARAADAVQGMAGAAVTVVGHADTSGDAAYNERLAAARTASVTDALVARGVPAGAIRAAAAGERNPAVATGDGVKAVENRRVTIMIGKPGA